MCATGVGSNPSPSFGCLKLRPMMSVNWSMVGRTFGSNAYRSFTVTMRDSKYHLCFVAVFHACSMYGSGL